MERGFLGPGPAGSRGGGSGDTLPRPSRAFPRVHAISAMRYGAGWPVAQAARRGTDARRRLCGASSATREFEEEG